MIYDSTMVLASFSELCIFVYTVMDRAHKILHIFNSPLKYLKHPAEAAHSQKTEAELLIDSTQAVTMLPNNTKEK